MKPVISALVTTILITTAPSSAAAAAMKLIIDLPDNAEQHVTHYQCEGEDDLRTVTYVNANPNFLAILILDGKEIIMASTVSGSGVEYVSGQFQWITKGADASLHDQLAGADAAPLTTCIEATDIP